MVNWIHLYYQIDDLHLVEIKFISFAHIFVIKESHRGIDCRTIEYWDRKWKSKEVIHKKFDWTNDQINYVVDHGLYIPLERYSEARIDNW